jgi:dihydropteroate synthase
MQDKLIEKKTSLNFRGKLEDINDPKIMGILNVTPDSFYDGDTNNLLETAIENVKKMQIDGADYIDIGGYSSRPGAKDISIQEELDRVLPIIEKCVTEFPDIVISIDTFRSEVAQEAINHGALMINDISGGDLDSKMWGIAANCKVPYIAMHMQGTPKTMQDSPSYTNVLDEVIFDLSNKITGMKEAGIMDIIIDPGFGFGKTIAHNYQMLQQLQAFELLGHPILVGLSRKSMIYNHLKTSPQEALNGTTVLNTIAINNGADILRVHDVKEAKQVLQLTQKVNMPIQ